MEVIASSSKPNHLPVHLFTSASSSKPPKANSTAIFIFNIKTISEIKENTANTNRKWSSGFARWVRIFRLCLCWNYSHRHVSSQVVLSPKLTRHTERLRHWCCLWQRFGNSWTVVSQWEGTSWLREDGNGEQMCPIPIAARTFVDHLTWWSSTCKRCSLISVKGLLTQVFPLSAPTSLTCTVFTHLYDKSLRK